MNHPLKKVRKLQVALVLPQHRLAWWHESLVESLSGAHEVKIFVDDHASPCPLPICAWLKLEHLLYREWRDPSAAFAGNDRPRSQDLDANQFDTVIDLSERAQPRAGAMVVCYDGSNDSTVLIDRLLGQQTPRLSVRRGGTNEILAESIPAIDDKFRLTRGLQLAFGRCIALVERALRNGRARAGSPPVASQAASPGLPAFVGRFVTQKMTNVLVNRLTATPQWSVALRNGSGPFVPVESEKGHFYADPFFYAASGKTFLFVEDYSDATRKAVIAAAEVVGDRLAGAPIPVLERPYHLSYPLVFAEAGEIFMLPETVGNRSVELYRAAQFPWKWQHESVLIEGMPLADATPVFHENRWWLFANMAQHGTTDHDELFIFYSDRLTGPWQQHADNPVKSDCRSARPAGRIVRRGDRLCRPAQDCETAYGSGIVWNEIVELTPTSFHEIEVARFKAPQAVGFDGLHHFEQLGALQAIDMRAMPSFRTPHTRMCKAMSCLGRGFDSSFQVAVSCGPS
jgi:hypothetical protein